MAMGKKKKLSRVQRLANATEFKALAVDVFGARGWAASIRDGLGYHYATVMRYANGDLAVPPVLMIVLRILAATPRRQWEPFLLRTERRRPGRPSAESAGRTAAGD